MLGFLLLAFVCKSGDLPVPAVFKVDTILELSCNTGHTRSYYSSVLIERGLKVRDLLRLACDVYREVVVFDESSVGLAYQVFPHRIDFELNELGLPVDPGVIYVFRVECEDPEGA